MDSFMMTFLLVVCLVAVQGASFNAKERRVLAGGDDSCPREGIRCRDCHTVSNCVGNISDGFTYVDMWKCPPKSVCDETQLACVPGGTCRYRKFSCPDYDRPSDKLLPDPYSCTEYHECDGGFQYDYVCDPGNAFNPIKGDCSHSLYDENCKSYPVPLCESIYDFGLVDGTDFYYYCNSYTNADGNRILYPIYHATSLNHSSTSTPWTSRHPTMIAGPYLPQTTTKKDE